MGQYKIVQRNKYLDELGLKPRDYGVNFTLKKDDRRKKWKKQRKLYGFDDRETYNLDKCFIEWLYSHLKMYLEKAGKIVDLEYESFEFEGKEYTQKEAIEDIILKCQKYLQGNLESDEQNVDNIQKATRLWAVILPSMWW